MGKVTIDINPKTILIAVSVLVVAGLAFLAGQYANQGGLGGANSAKNNNESSEVDSSSVMAQINPPEGYELKATYGDIGPKLLAAGAVDLEKFKDIYVRAGKPLTQEQLDILTKGSNEKIKITPQNSYFLLNFLWAAGLANKNPILDKGPIATSGTDVGNFASTGGWTIGAKSAVQIFSNSEIVRLTSEQQKIVEDFANNSYRPCCGNSTGFPDCNHGMAMLGLAEIMASQGATSEELFEAFKYVNAFWFPETYFDIATYFKAKENKDWKDVDARVIAGQDYSSAQGAQAVKQWLANSGNVKEAPSGGEGGCGV